jgi:hypothetical protein
MYEAPNKITACYCRLSQEEERVGESPFIENHDVLYKGLVTPPKTTS